VTWDALPPPREQYAEEVTSLLCALIRFDTSNPPGSDSRFVRQVILKTIGG